MSTTARSYYSIVILGLLVGVTVACSLGGSGVGDQPTAVDSGGNVTQTAVPFTDTSPSSTPAPENVAENGAPIFADGAWTGGEAEARVTGSDTRTIAGTLLERASVTEGGSTLLTYTTDLDTISISISPRNDPFGVTAYQEPSDIRVPFDQPQCEVVYQEASDTRIEGTFRCEHAESKYGPNQGPMLMEGEFTATR